MVDIKEPGTLRMSVVSSSFTHVYVNIESAAE